jgi:hypothetical protein
MIATLSIYGIPSTTGFIGKGCPESSLKGCFFSLQAINFAKQCQQPTMPANA